MATGKKQQQPMVSVIIPTWNSDEYLPRCLDCLEKQTFQRFEVTVVDNGSSEFDDQLICDYQNKLQMSTIILEENVGFAAACNLGVKTAQGEWLAFLNADAFPSPDWLERFIEAQNSYPDARSFCSNLVQANNPKLIDGTGDVYNISGYAWKNGNGYPLKCAPDQPERVFSANAAASFYRRDVFHEVGRFDEDFFSFYEDVDLGFRLNMSGYACYFLPEVKALHVGSSSAKREGSMVQYHRHRNMEWVYLKNLPVYLFWLYLPAHLLGNTIFLIDAIRKKQGAIFLRAKWDALRGCRKMFEKRKAIQKAKRANVRDIHQLIDKRIFAPYLLGINLRRYNREHADESKPEK